MTFKAVENPIKLIGRTKICEQFGYDEARLDWLLARGAIPKADAVIDGRRLAWIPANVQAWVESRNR